MEECTFNSTQLRHVMTCLSQTTLPVDITNNDYDIMDFSNVYKVHENQALEAFLMYSSIMVYSTTR